MLVNPSGAEPTECIYPRAAVAPLPGPGLRISQPLRGCRVLRLSEHGRATPSDTIYCIYLCISPEVIERLVAFGVHKLGYGQRKGDPPMAKNYAMTAIRRSLEGAHSSVTPGQEAKRPQPGDSSEQGKSASKRLTSIFDAKIPLFVSCADTRTSVPTSGCSLLYKLVDGHNNEHQKQHPNVGTLVRASAQPTCSHKPHPLQGCTLRVR